MIAEKQSLREDRNTDLDRAYLQILEIIRSIAGRRIENKLEEAKHRIFWKTLREIAGHNLNKIGTNSELLNPTFSKVLQIFPDKKMKSDGRMWLPMHFAMCVPDMNIIGDIQILVDNDPSMIKQGSGGEYNYTPGHLAVMMKNPNLALIERLKVYDPNFAAAKTIQQSTPLHLAAQYSSSVAVIKELIRTYPPALGMKDNKRDFFAPMDSRLPLHCSLLNRTKRAPDILKAIVDVAPETARDINTYGRSPLHYSLQQNYENRKFPQGKMVSILLEAFPDAVDVQDENGLLPIHYAAKFCKTNVFQMIIEAIPAHLAVLNEYGSVAHFAVDSERIDNLRYIHSKMPELLVSIDGNNMTPLHKAVTHYYRNIKFIEALASLAPEAALNRDNRGDNLLHTLAVSTNSPEIDCDLFRHLLRLIPGGALATNHQGRTPYDLLKADNPDHHVARRLLLLAGAPSLHPETRKQMNYQARKGALFAFFAPRGQHHSGGADICHRILHGAGAMEIMRQVISFL